MTEEEHENYIAEMVSMLSLARLITKEDARNETSLPYQMLAHLLEAHLGDTADVGTYINTLVDTSIDPITRLRNMLKMILKAMPIVSYKIMKPAVQVLWSA